MAKEKLHPFLKECRKRKVKDGKDFIIIKIREFQMNTLSDFEWYIRYQQPQQKMNILGMSDYYYGSFDGESDYHFYFSWSKKGFKDLNAELKTRRVKKHQRLVEVRLGTYSGDL